MNPIYNISSVSATYRFVGVITIGVTKLPLIGFGYPEDMPLHDQFPSKILPALENHRFGDITIHPLDQRSDRITWRIFKSSMVPADLIPENAFFSLFLDLPVESREDVAHARLFSSAAAQENGFIVAVTVLDKTHLYFYHVLTTDLCPGTDRIHRLSGEVSRIVSGNAVPLLRTIERLKSNCGPQRRIEVPDHELGIIYQSVLGDDH
jgi:hypothetical protein